MQIFNKYFKNSLIFIVLAELFSIFGYLYPVFNTACFIVICLIVLILSLKKIEYGIYILLSELFIGSKGYLFSLDLGGASVSIRMGLFLIIMAVWASQFVKTKQILYQKIKQNKLLFNLFGVLCIFVGIGIVSGFINNRIDNIIFDFNAYLYFALFLPILTYIDSKEKAMNILNIFLAAVTYLGAKSLFLCFFFSHQLDYYFYAIYKWVRDTGVGEITLMPDSGFARIFIQSQIFSLAAIFIILFLMIYWVRNQELGIRNRELWGLLSVLVLAISAILISFSRSFWVGGAVGIIFTVACLAYIKIGWKNFGKIVGIGVISVLASCVIIFAAVKIPVPGLGYGEFGAGLFGERATSIIGEAGAGSRWNLLPELWKGIKKSPILGSGFGSEITYQSLDPRILASSPKGEYTTYAFEWGYLDIWLKIGILGLLAYLSLIGYLLYVCLKKSEKILEKDIYGYLLIGFLVGLLTICATSIFSPYLNHPLGIGYIILYTTFLLI